MNELALHNSTNNQDSTCRELIMMAERELAAFFSAVSELFGTEQAEVTAEDWLQELMAISGLPASTRQWRQLTLKVLARVASRLDGSSSATAWQALAYSD